jgi:predicted ArsR family transcriptional regulator
VSNSRAPRVSIKDLSDAISAKPAGTWLTVSALMREVGGSPATVRKVLDELASDGTVTDPIDDPKHSGKGRAPKVWERN